MSPWSALEADTHRYFGGFSTKQLIKGFLSNRTFRVLVTMRICQKVSNSGGLIKLLLPLAKACHRTTSHHAAMDFPWDARVGRGLSIPHGWGLVLNARAVVGSNVTLFHGVTLGQRDRISREGVRETEYPILEDEVWVGPHAIIVGGITIGKGSRIAGGAFVTQSVPPFSMVSGNPASIVKSNCISDVFNPAPLNN